MRQHTSPYTYKFANLINKGWKYILAASFKAIVLIPISFLLFKPFLRLRKFTYQDKTFTYSTHWYNSTWRCERAVEIPIFIPLIENHHKIDILEIGNVMSHYISTTHDVVDKYESGRHVINKDILDFQTIKRYRIIISISTLEHIGVDEEQFEPEKAIAALIKLQSLLTPDGEIHITVPMGYNLALDTYFIKNPDIFKQVSFMKRISRTNRWIEKKFLSEENIQYGNPYSFANVILIGIIDAAANLDSTTIIENKISHGKPA